MLARSKASVDASWRARRAAARWRARLHLGPTAKRWRNAARPPSAWMSRLSCSYGNLGLIYLPLGDERLTLEQIAVAHPRLVPALSAHPGVGFVMVRSAADGAIVIGAGGRRRLADDAVEGE